MVDISTALEKAASSAAREALGQLATPDVCTFFIYAHTPGGSDAARRGFRAVSPDVIAYGGPALAVDGSWSLWSESDVTVDPEDEQKVFCVAVCGSLSYLMSAVIKNWVQPTYTEALSYLKPKYVGDAEMDLLVAIRYNDWKKFKWCIEEENVHVDFKWTHKQNQTPLLAACARLRTKMVSYLLSRGVNASHRNDSGYTAVMYTKMLSDYDEKLVRKQLTMLGNAGVEMKLNDSELCKIQRVVRGRIIE